MSLLLTIMAVFPSTQRMELGTGRGREISPLIWILSVLFLLRHAFLGSE